MVIEAAKGGHTTVVKLLLEYPNRVLMNQSQELPQLTAADQHLVEVNTLPMQASTGHVIGVYGIFPILELRGCFFFMITRND